MKKVNYMSLLGVIMFNLILGIALWFSILGILLSFWVIMVAFTLSPLIFIAVILVKFQKFAYSQLTLSFLLMVVGVILYSFVKKSTKIIVNFGKKYLEYNQKMIFS
ncbi:HAAS domain-containing protein [Melissococcus plutonius]|uniref:XRE family transcriptional regulator n=1 Tax=Melissococcus plutonius (strain ATCC 35311 / DSM 29964 / CIP 104052 / LMG 20360 / NCIMB 702443) TaxID=940190 RepID=F3YCM4_MELPT|nr:DUF1700 domain-containing protein [Melissococcus plutonius]AIM26156.1 hypothetical protein MEPL_178p001310 [Melissococcus plutonius S1]KMT23577.1 hypothetical protein MEPL2_5c00950 [Melissococcus plutonius]KMT23627.1 hypothetical protein MEPL3_9c00190 [Melissococcus plutonius]KMT24264.1 hypothetical protein MEPL1_10c00110 [Melissococcus plutonius]KMT28091.1 hypothetical protein MEPL4_7c00430 [Melissococcus plutonius]